MLENERIEFRQKLREGLTRSQYKLIREKALRNENIIEGDYKGGIIEVSACTPSYALYLAETYKGGIIEVSARELLKKLYNEDIVVLTDDKPRQ